MCACLSYSACGSMQCDMCAMHSLATCPEDRSPSVSWDMTHSGTTRHRTPQQATLHQADSSKSPGWRCSWTCHVRRGCRSQAGASAAPARRARKIGTGQAGLRQAQRAGAPTTAGPKHMAKHTTTGRKQTHYLMKNHHQQSAQKLHATNKMACETLTSAATCGAHSVAPALPSTPQNCLP